jgi:simple sugar transport system substrate-binding protein
MMAQEESGDFSREETGVTTGMSRRELFRKAAIGTTALSIPAVVSALGRMPGTAEAAQSLAPLAANPYPGHPRWRFTFVNHVTTNSFFVPTQYGAQDAARLFNCQFQWTGSQNSIVLEMVNAMNAAIAANVDGIAVAIIDPHAFNDPVNRALAKGIPVVSYNADAPASSNNSRLAYIGQDLFLSGQKMGKRIVNLVGRGDVVLFIATPGTLNIQPRINGAAAAIKASGGKVHYQEIASGALEPDELARIEAYYLGHKSIKGMFAVDNGSTHSIAQISEKYHLKGRVKTGGYDLHPITLAAIASGFLNFTIDQQPYLQGFVPMQQLFLYKLSGGLMFPSDTNTGIKFVTKATVGKYNHTTSRYEGSSPAEKWIH